MSSLSYNKFLVKQHVKKLSFIKGTYFFQHSGLFAVAVILIVAFPITVALTNKNPNNRIATFFRVTNSVCDGNGCQDYSGAGGVGADQALQSGTGLIGGVYDPTTQNGGVQNQLYNNPVNYQGSGIAPQPGTQTGLYQAPAGTYINPQDSNPNSTSSILCYQPGGACAGQGVAPGVVQQPVTGNTNTGTTNTQQPVTYCAGGTNTQTCYQTGNTCTCTANNYLPTGMVPWNGSQDTYNPNAVNPDGTTGKWIDNGTATNPVVGVTPVIYNNTGGGYAIAPTIPASQARPIASAPTPIPTAAPTAVPPTQAPAATSKPVATAPNAKPTNTAEQDAIESETNDANQQDAAALAAIGPGTASQQATSNSLVNQLSLTVLQAKEKDLTQQLSDVVKAKQFFSKDNALDNPDQKQLAKLNDIETQTTDQLRIVRDAINKLQESDTTTTPTPNIKTYATSCNPVNDPISGLSINIPQNLCDSSIKNQAPADYIYIGPSLNTGISLNGIGNNTKVGQNNKPLNPLIATSIELQTPDKKDFRFVNSSLLFDPDSGKYDQIVPLGGNIPAGTYKVKVRTNNSLWKDAGTINLNPGQKTDLPNLNLVSGDLNQDNRLDLSDYNAIITCITNKNCSTGNIADLNQDGKFDEEDLNILYSNFKTRNGD